jgi:two-component system chemotaxis sensor kinase CheA
MLYWEEAKEQLEVLELNLMKLELTPNDEMTVNTMFRMAHSLKGSSATLGLDDLAKITHDLETIFSSIKNQQCEINSTLFNQIYRDVDQLKELHHNLFLEPASYDTNSNDSNGASPITIQVIFCKDAQLISVTSFMILEAIKPFGKCLKVTPESPEDCDDIDFTMGLILTLELNSLSSMEDLTHALSAISDIESIHVQDQLPLPLTDEDKQPIVPTETSQSELTSIKVSTTKINKLINLVSELMLDKSALNVLARNLKNQHGHDPTILRLVDVTEHMSELVSNLQEIALSTRMLPLELLLGKFPRMVRDIAQQSSKEINLVIEGASHSLDRAILESLNDPITHLLRNAIDHGIESPTDRQLKGKSPQGTISIKANQGEDHIILTIADDGKGIDYKLIQKKALEKGLVSIDEAQYYNQDDWLSLLFKPGFSTLDSASTLSGRGVGLDVVKTNLSRINAQIEVTSVYDHGSSFTLKLPLTLAIMKAMIVKESQINYGIPLSCILEILHLKNDDFLAYSHKTLYSHVLKWRELAIPLYGLEQYFNKSSLRCLGDKQTVIVIASGELVIGLVVDQLLIEEELVVRSLGNYIGPGKILGPLSGISGTALMGDGSVCYVLDTSTMISEMI